MGPSSLFRATLWIGAVVALLYGCGGPQLPSGAPGSALPGATGRHARGATQSPIAHLIVVVQQGRSFNDLFAGYPGADSQTYGCAEGSSARPPTSGSGCPSGDTTVPLQQVALDKGCVVGRVNYFPTAYNNGAMDGWNQLYVQNPLCPYTTVRRGDTRPYWRIARAFALADQAFASTHFGPFPNMLYTIAATTQLGPNKYVAGPPLRMPWGCDAPPGTRTTLLVNGHLRYQRGPYPCFTQFHTMADLFDPAGVSWRYYFNLRGLFNPFSAIKGVYEGPDWQADMRSPATKVLSDIAKGKLADVSWVLSPLDDSDAPGTRGGPNWVAALAAALQNSAYWRDSAIVVMWNDDGTGRYYDAVPPKFLDAMGLGFRVPMLVISKYAKHGYVSHTAYEYGSILKFMEENWSLGSLGGTDQRANSIADMFSFK